MLWFFFVLFEIFIWNYHVRAFFVGEHPVIQMGASALNDLIWLPVATALPIYIAILLRKISNRLILREGAIFILFIFCFTCFVNLDFLFRIQFVLIFLFLLLWGIHIYKSRMISLRLLFFCLTLLGMILHYKTQLLPPLLPQAPFTLSVMSFNLNTRGAFDDERTIQFIRHRFPDVVFLQELFENEKELIVSRLGNMYPYYLSPARRMGKNDVMILSRKELLYGDHIPLRMPDSESFHSINHAVIRVDGQKIHLINCHLHHAYKQLGAYVAAPDSLELFEILAQSYHHQHVEAKMLADYVKTLEGPTIIAGDFNDTPNSYTYDLLQKSYQNAFAAAGWGTGTTFGQWTMQSHLPRFMRGLGFDIFRIDHLFFSNEFHILNAKVEKVGAFDHHPQIVQVVFKSKVESKK